MINKKRGYLKSFRYLIFCIFHFFVYELQFAISDGERKTFMNKYHGNDLSHG